MMDTIGIDVLSFVAICLIYLVLMGTAAWSKWKSLSTPDWFIHQFQNTVIAKIPNGAKIGYWIIAFVEAVLAILFFLALFIPYLNPIALVGSLFLFGMLCFGLRLAGDYQGSANMFIYFAATLVSLQAVR